MKIFIGFSKPKNKMLPLFSWAIRLIERTSYSHTYIQWNAGSMDTPITYHAAGHSLNFIGSDVFNSTISPKHLYEIEINEAQYRRLLNYCFLNCGKSYGSIQILGMIYVKVLKLLRITRGNPFADGEKTQVCSELVARIISNYVDIDKDFDMVSPKDVKRILDNSKNPKITRII